ncbi:MAG: sulfotransferase, partial [Gammaproteobacteria bacterium]|nr:sulfotransferase [Gammaproteobacteria bacterium]
GQPDAGLQLLSELVEQNEASTDTRLAAASLARRCGRRDTALEYLAPLLDDDHEPLAQLDVAHRRRLAFLLGDVYDASADCKQALRYYDIGNQCVDGRFDADRHYRFIDNIINHYSEPPADTGAPRTTRRLFIVGMPRSGTSLLETMLSRHPDIHACGELALLGQLLGDVGFPDAGLSDSDFARLAEQYCTGVAAPPGARWMTDKMPLNFQYVGAISHMLPDAHIIHCERDPRDTMLSCYFQNFLDPALDFSFDLDDLSHYYRNYQRLMRHWHDNFPAHISSLKYEDLVEDPGFVMQPLLERLGLPWDDHVLQPQDSGRYVGTASHAQVREPIHRRSVGRFARYRPFLDERAEIFDALA